MTHPTRLWLVTLLFVLPKCASYQSRNTRTYVTAQGVVVRAQDATHGCDGSRLDAEAHEQYGGRIGVHTDGQHTVVGGVSLGAVHTTRADDSSYVLKAAHARVGYNWPYGGVDVGVNLWAADGQVTLLPSLQGRFGKLDHTWGFLQVGARESLFDAAILSGGLGLRRDRFEGSGALGFFSHPLLTSFDGTDEEIGLEALAQLGDFGLRLDLAYRVTDRSHLMAGATLSATPSVWIGVRFDLPSTSE